MNTSIEKANRLFKKGDYSSALEMYTELMATNKVWRKVLAANHRICLNKLQSLGAGKHYDQIDFIFDIPANISSRKKILVTDFRYPRFDTSAGELATYGIIKIFAQLGHDVIFIPKESTEFDAPYIRALRRFGVTCVENVFYDNFKDKVVEASKYLYIAYIFRPDVARLCIPAIRAISSEAYIFYHAPDVYFRREKAQYDIELTESGKSRKSGIDSTRINQIVLDEVYAATSADHVVCVSDGDAVALKAAMEDPHLNKSDLLLPEISTFPVLYLERKTALPEFNTTSNICFVGSSEHRPNSDAIRWFLEKVWEQLSAKNPGLCFHIIGKTNETEKTYYEQFKNVVVVGWVDSVEETLPKYKLTIAPLRYGAGIKGKVGTSLIVGVPCVASKVAIEDMGLVPDVEVILAESVDDYVNRITHILQDESEWRRLSRNGAIKAEQLYSHEATFKRFIRILNDNNALDIAHYLSFINKVARTKKPISFPALDKDTSIDVSIVVPAYNNLELSRMCLASIYYSILPNDSIHFEVIYADDCSETNVIPELTSQFTNMVVTKTEANGGFVINTNIGSSVAKGTILVLLNNDAVVIPSWLDGLLQVIQSNESCYVAGSKMLYPNGKLQEAGAGLWTDGRALNQGRGDTSTTPEWNYVREVDYISFASVAIRKDYWDQVGGLNTQYGLGYFDDSDFCMGVRANKGIVLYAPNSEIVHNESATFSKRKCKPSVSEKNRNGSLFRQKWASQLIKNHLYFDPQCWNPNHSESIIKANAARHNIVPSTKADAFPTNKLRNGRHILYFSPFPSHPASHGNRTTIKKFGEFLQSEGYTVHFALLHSNEYSPDDVVGMEQAWETLDIIKLPHFPTCNGKEISFDGWYVNGLGEQIALLCARYRVDTVICSYIFQSKLLEYVPSYILKIIDTHDMFTERYTILDKLGKPREFFSCTRQQEGWYLSRADVVLARRDEEREYFDEISTAKVYTVPHIEDKCYLDKKEHKLSKVGLVASANLINLDIVVTFVYELIQQKKDKWGFKIVIAGQVKQLVDLKDPTQACVAQHPDVEFTGFVSDIKDFYQDVDMIVCPIMSGTGINVKTVQALAHGLPILATQHASKGVGTQYPNHQFADIPSLVKYLLATKFDADVLKTYSNQSRTIFDTYIESGNENFRKALNLSQADLRDTVGQRLHTKLQDTFSKKSRLASLSAKRKEKQHRGYLLKSIIFNLDNFGPSWINLNEPLPNIQSSGGVGFWFKLKTKANIREDIYLYSMGDKYLLHKSACGTLLTCEIPAGKLETPGSYPLRLGLMLEPDDADATKEFRFGTLELVKN